MTESDDGQQVVGVDLYRQRSVLVRMTGDGRKLETARITSSAPELRRVIAKAGEHPKVVLEATYAEAWSKVRLLLGRPTRPLGVSTSVATFRPTRSRASACRIVRPRARCAP